MKQFIAKATILSLVLGLFVYAAPAPVKAAGVTLAVDVQNIAASTATDTTYNWTSSDYTDFSDSDEIIFTIKDSSNSNIAGSPSACASADTDFDNDAGADGAFTFAAATATYTFSDVTEVTAGTANLCFKVPSLTADIYTVIMSDNDGSGDNVVPGDFGAVLLYVGDDNDVYVTGDVAISLQMSLSANVCDLGSITESAVATCNYTVTLGSTASSGIETKITSDGDLTSGSNTITAVVEDATVTASNDTEQYGIAVTAAGNTTESGDFNDDDTPIPTSPTNIFTQSGPVPTAEASTITHRATSANATEAGHYVQWVTYTTVATF